jgi:phage terminase large subunit-like protein
MMCRRWWQKKPLRGTWYDRQPQPQSELWHLRSEARQDKLVGVCCARGRGIQSWCPYA